MSAILRRRAATGICRILTAMTCIATLWIGATACLADNLPILVYPCPKPESPPAIDGKLDDAGWRAAPAVDTFTNFGQAALAPVQTFLRAAYDDESLYLAITCNEPTPRRISPTAFARDALELFRSEAVEIFLDPGHTHSAYCQFGVSPAGALYDMSSNSGEPWDSRAVLATAVGDQAWYVEIAIPWRGLGVTPQRGQVHGLNVCRDRYFGTGQPWSSWSRVTNTFHDPPRFGHLVLAPTAEMMAAMTTEFRKGGRTGPLVVASAEGLGDASYRAMLQTEIGQLDARLTELRALAQKEQDGTIRRALTERIDQFVAEEDKARAALDTKTVDAESFTQAEERLNAIRSQLDDLLWRVRLETLLSGI
jgi:hypothetical protein